MLHAKDLTKEYDGNRALDGLNLSVESGDIYCLLGANGAGKSTTINLFLNFIKPTSGVAVIDQMDVAREPLKTKEVIAYIPENLNLYGELTGMENLEYFVGISGKKYVKDELANFLNEAGLQQAAHRQRVKGYSKGMRQKVGIAIA